MDYTVQLQEIFEILELINSNIGISIYTTSFISALFIAFCLFYFLNRS